MQGFVSLPIAGTLGPVVFGIVLVANLIGAIFGGLFGGGSPDLSGVVKAVNQLNNNLGLAVDTITRFAWAIGRAFAFGLLFLYHLLTDLLGKIWDAIKKLGAAMAKVVGKILPAIVNAIKNARAFLNEIYKRFIRPALVVLQYVRRILSILEAFHIGWARKLDAVLANIQGRILAPFFWVIRQINGVGGWLNVILTAKATIQRAVFINSMYSYLGEWVNLWWVGQLGGAFGGATPVIQPPGATPSLAEQAANIDLYTRTGSGPLAIDAVTAQSAMTGVLAGA